MSETGSGKNRLVSYDWQTNEHFLIRHLVPDLVSIEASLYDTPEQVVARIPSGTKQFLFHLNCTVTRRFPLSRQALVSELQARRISVLNENVHDISKFTIQQACVGLGLPTTRTGPQGNPNEAIIVKSNLNFAGKTEWSLSDDERRMLGLGQPSDIVWDPYDYRVLPRSEVRDEWWVDPRLVCERYVENEANRWYRAYAYLDRVALCSFTCKMRIKKVSESKLEKVLMLAGGEAASGILSDGSMARMSGQISIFRRGFGLDFGTIDLVEDGEGRTYIIDANTTPAYNSPVEGLCAHLAGAGMPSQRYSS